MYQFYKKLNSNFTIDRFCLPKERTYFNVWAIQGALVQSLSLSSAIYWLKLRALQKRVQDNLDLHAQNTTIPPPALNQEVIISRLYIYETNCERRSSGRLSQAGRREKYSKKLNYNLTFDTASDTTEEKTVASLWEKGVEDKVLQN